MMTASNVFTTVYDSCFFFIVKSHDDMKMELDCQNLDSEFGLFGCREEPKTTPDRPGHKIFLTLAVVSTCFVKVCPKFHDLNIFVYGFIISWPCFTIGSLVAAVFCFLFIVLFQIGVHFCH